MSEVRRSKRLAEKMENSTEMDNHKMDNQTTADSHKESRGNSSKGSVVLEQDLVKIHSKVSLNADSKKKISEGSITSRKSRSAKTKHSSVSSRRQKEAEIEIAIKKKELEQQLLESSTKKQQEILDLQLALKIAQIQEEEWSESELEGESIRSIVHESGKIKEPNIEKWIDGQAPWNKQQDEENATAVLSVNKSPQVCDNQEIHSTTNNNLCQCQATNPHFTKILTRQSIPKDLPIFSGDPTEWPNFIYHYNNSTALCGYSNEENQCRLQKCLKGNAKRIVQSLLILPKNVDKVISLLTSRFGRPEYIISLLMDKVRKFPSFKEDRLEILIDFSDEVKNLVATIETLEEEDHLRNPLLL